MCVCSNYATLYYGNIKCILNNDTLINMFIKLCEFTELDVMTGTKRCALWYEKRAYPLFPSLSDKFWYTCENNGNWGISDCCSELTVMGDLKHLIGNSRCYVLAEKICRHDAPIVERVFAVPKGFRNVSGIGSDILLININDDDVIHIAEFSKISELGYESTTKRCGLRYRSRSYSWCLVPTAKFSNKCENHDNLTIYYNHTETTNQAKWERVLYYDKCHIIIDDARVGNVLAARDAFYIYGFGIKGFCDCIAIIK